MELEHYRVIPFSKINPSGCSIIADRGRAALDKLQSWGLDRGITGSLADAIRHLRGVAIADSFGVDAKTRRVTLDAIHLCTDFFQVAASLGEIPIKPAVDELAIALQGRLTGTPHTRKAREYLSQFWVGTVLTLANIEPRIIPATPDRRTPDFVVDLGGLDWDAPASVDTIFRCSYGIGGAAWVRGSIDG